MRKPRKLYHGTTKDNLASILISGIEPRGIEKLVYTSVSRMEALMFTCMHKAEQIKNGAEIIVLEINTKGMDYDRKYARKYLKKGDILTIEEIYVGRSSSKVKFQEYPDLEFNTVMFEDVEDTQEVR